MKNALIMSYEFLGGSLLFITHHYFQDLINLIVDTIFVLFVVFIVCLYIYLDIKLK